MEDKVAIERHDQQIKTLFKRVDDMDSMKDVLHNLDKNSALSTQLLQNIVEHNQKQDLRMDKQDKRMDERDKVMAQMSETLTTLSTEIVDVKAEVKEVKVKQDENEEKHMIDRRDVSKEADMNTLRKYGVPFSAGLAIAYLLLELLKAFK